jgi:hypothetical protein
MMEMTYVDRLKLLNELCQVETQQVVGRTEDEARAAFANIDVDEAAYYIASFVTFRAIQTAGRHPGEELQTDFDMLGVYQCFGLMVYAFLFMPLTQEGYEPDYGQAQVTIGKNLFEGISAELLAEIIESGFHKFQLIAEAEADHWLEYRENLDKVTISYLIAATDDESPHTTAEILPLFGQLLSQLCEAFSAI